MIVLVSFFYPGKNGSVNYDITITFKGIKVTIFIFG